MVERAALNESYEHLLVERDDQRYVLRLFITGMTPRSTEAVAVLKEICERLLAGRYELEIVDLYKHPERAHTDEVVASPTLVKRFPLPVRRLIGNLSNQERVLNGLDLLPEDEPSAGRASTHPRPPGSGAQSLS